MGFVHRFWCFGVALILRIGLDLLSCFGGLRWFGFAGLGLICEGFYVVSFVLPWFGCFDGFVLLMVCG